jgi:DNA-binding FadR family transcriptional regulator
MPNELVTPADIAAMRDMLRRKEAIGQSLREEPLPMDWAELLAELAKLDVNIQICLPRLLDTVEALMAENDAQGETLAEYRRLVGEIERQNDEVAFNLTIIAEMCPALPAEIMGKPCRTVSMAANWGMTV